MIDHDDRRVDDDPQRDRDPGERINMDIQPEQVVKDHGDQDIDHERRHDNQQIAEIPADQIDEQQQDGDAEQRADVDFMQFPRDVLRSVVGQRRGQFIWEGGLKALHLRLDRRGDLQDIRVRIADHREVDRIEAVDAEIARRERFAPARRGEIAQVVDAAVAARDGNLPEIEPGTVSELQHDAPLAAVGLRERRHTDHVAAEIILECQGKIRGRDPGGLHCLGEERDDPFEGGDTRQHDPPDPLDLRQRGRDVGLHILFDAFGGQVGLDRIDQRLGFAAAGGGERNIGIGNFLRQLAIEIPDRRRDFETGGFHVRSLTECDRDIAVALGRAGGDVLAPRDGRHGAFDTRGGALLDQARRGVRPGEIDVDPSPGLRRRILDIEHGQHGRPDDRQRRHDQQHRKCGDAPPRRGYGSRDVHRRGR